VAHHSLVGTKAVSAELSHGGGPINMNGQPQQQAHTLGFISLHLLCGKMRHWKGFRSIFVV
jgi:hypothetical protein